MKRVIGLLDRGQTVVGHRHHTAQALQSHRHRTAQALQSPRMGCPKRPMAAAPRNHIRPHIRVARLDLIGVCP